MKLASIIGVAAIALGFCACDNIDEQDRFIPIEFQKSEKMLLIEEFTGSRCPNCPDGAAAIAAIHAHPVYGENVIPVSLYPEQLTSLTRPFPNQQDLRTKVASDIFDKYNTRNALPAAMFNRQSLDGDILQITSSKWSGYASTYFDNKDYAPANIELTSSYNEATRELTVQYQTQFVSAVAQDVSFQIYILEDGIITRQSSTSGVNPNYENNHVLRTALNGTWGKSYGAAHLAGTSFEGESKVVLDANWKAENIQVVGFLCNTDGNREVLHAAAIKSITE